MFSIVRHLFLLPSRIHIGIKWWVLYNHRKNRRKNPHYKRKEKKNKEIINELLYFICKAWPMTLLVKALLIRLNAVAGSFCEHSRISPGVLLSYLLHHIWKAPGCPANWLPSFPFKSPLENTVLWFKKTALAQDCITLYFEPFTNSNGHIYSLLLPIMFGDS